jgi:Flp pilus assembly protein TadB
MTGATARARALHRMTGGRPAPTPRSRPVPTAVTLDALGREIRAGSSLHGAFVAVARDEGRTSALGAVADAVEQGTSVAVACGRWTAAPLAATAIEVAHRCGGSVARAIDGAAATARERDALAADARVQATQAVASAVVVAGAPTVFGVVMGLADPSVPAFFVSGPIGATCLASGLALQGVGAWWMRSMVVRTR